MPCTKCQQSYLDSYQVALDGVKKADTAISDHEARVRVAQLFRPKFHQWKEAAKIEDKGEKEYQNGEFAFNDRGEMYYLKTGETAEGLHVNQKRLSELPDHSSGEYSVEDHLITRLIQSALREGATQVVTSYGRTDGKNRDVLEFNYDQISKRGFIRVLNTESNGHYRVFDEIKQIAKTRYSSLHETKISQSIFVLSDKPLEESKVRQTVAHLEQRVGHAIKETVITAGKNTLQEAKQTAISIEGYIRRKQDVRPKEMPIVAGDTLIPRMRRMFEHKENKEAEAVQMKKQKINRPDRPFSSEKLRNTQKKIQEKIATSVATLLFVRATGVGAGGVFEPLRTISRLPKISLESPKRIKKEKQQRPKRTLEKMRVFRKSEASKKLTKKEQRLFRRKERLLLKKEKKIIERKERKIMRRKEKVLWKTLTRLVQKTERQVLPVSKEKKKKKGILIQKEHQAKKQERQHVKDFSIALVIWLLLRLPEKRQEVKVTKHEKLKKLVHKEPAPWILFAIIWHLAMIREGGMRVVGQQKKAQKKQTHHYPISMPPAGVIFAFAS